MQNDGNLNDQTPSNNESNLDNDLARYLKFLGVEKNNETTLKELLKISLDNRNNEINRYWSRAAYFWVFIASIFAAFLSIYQLDIENLYVSSIFNVIIPFKNMILALLAFLGVLFSLIWIFNNISSKYWHSNWECHSENLTKILYGDIFGVIKNQKGFALYSVSKLNKALSIIVFVIWAIIYIVHCAMSFGFNVTVIIYVLTACLLIYFSCKLRSDSKYKTPGNWFIKKIDREKRES